MKCIIKSLAIIGCITLLNACAPLQAPIVKQYATINNYKYAYVNSTNGLTSGSGGMFGFFGIYGSFFGSSSTKSINPEDVIKGILIKKGFVILPEIQNQIKNETMIVNYGESNYLYGGYIEVSIQFVSAKTNEVICVTIADGNGGTETDAIREAIYRAMSAIFPE